MCLKCFKFRKGLMRMMRWFQIASFRPDHAENYFLDCSKYLLSSSIALDIIYVHVYNIVCTMTQLLPCQPRVTVSDVMFCLQSYQDLESIDHVCINPIHRIGLIHM